MIAVVQRVQSASVRVASDEVARIGAGFLVLAGVRKGDGSGDIARGRNDRRTGSTGQGGLAHDGP